MFPSDENRPRGAASYLSHLSYLSYPSYPSSPTPTAFSASRCFS